MVETADDKVVPVPVPTYQTPDWFLAMLVGFANEYQTAQSITLFVEGAVVTGKLIGGREYFTRLAETMAGTPDLFAKISDAFYPAGEDTEKPDVRLSFIHLKDARVYQSGVQLPQNYKGLVWRGRLEAVSGFTIGEMESRPAQ